MIEARRSDARERGGGLQQPVQQRDPSRGESGRTSTDDASRSPEQIAYRRTGMNSSNVTGGQGVVGSHSARPDHVVPQDIGDGSKPSGSGLFQQFSRTAEGATGPAADRIDRW